jgi:DNA polymerase III subunit delta
MFSADRVVWIRGLGTEPAGETEALHGLLSAGLPPGSTLVATTARLDQRSRLYKWFRTNAEVIDLSIGTDKRGRLNDADADAFIRARLAAGGIVNTPPNTIASIRRRAGRELGNLAQQIDKLCLACANTGRISAADIATHVRDESETWVFDLTGALSARQLGRAAEVLDQILRQGEPPIRLVVVLAGHIANLIEAVRVRALIPHTALRNSGAFARDYFPKLPDEFRNRFKSGIRAYYVLEEAAGFELDELRRLHRALVEADLALKSSRVVARDLLFAIVEDACCRRPVPSVRVC